MSSETRETMERLLSANGVAGTVEVDGSGDPEYQHFVAQAGPFPEGESVVVLGKEDADRILAANLTPPQSEPEPVFYVTPDAVEFFRNGGIVGDFVLGVTRTEEQSLPAYIGSPPQSTGDERERIAEIVRLHALQYGASDDRATDLAEDVAAEIVPRSTPPESREAPVDGEASTRYRNLMRVDALVDYIRYDRAQDRVRSMVEADEKRLREVLARTAPPQGEPE